MPGLLGGLDDQIQNVGDGNDSGGLIILLIVNNKDSVHACGSEEADGAHECVGRENGDRW